MLSVKRGGLSRRKNIGDYSVVLLDELYINLVCNTPGEHDPLPRYS